MTTFKAGLPIASAVALGFLALSGPSARADVTIWLGTCSTEDWHHCCEIGASYYNNWHAIGFEGSCAGAWPDSDDDIYLDGYDVLHAGGWITYVNSIESHGVFTMRSSQLSVNATAYFTDTLLWEGGNLTGATSHGTFDIGPGAPTSPAYLELRTSDSKGLANSTLNIHADSNAVLTANSIIMLNTTSEWNVQPGGSFDARSAAVFIPNPFDGAGQFHNLGTMLRSAGDGVLMYRIPFHNAGSLDVQTGIVRVAAGTCSGSINIDAGAAFEIDAYDPVYAGAGGDFVVSAGSTFTADGLVRVTEAGALNLATGALIAIPNLELAASGILAGAIRGPGELEIVNILTWLGGSMQDAGVTTILPAATAAISGDHSKLLSARTLDNFGSIVWTGGGNLEVTAEAVINNAAGATFDVATDADMAVICCAGGATINNSGEFVKSAGSDTTSIGAAFHNAGTLLVNAGTLSFPAGLTQTAGLTRLAGGNLAAGSPTSLLGGILDGSGNIAAHITNGGTISPGLSPGLITMSGIIGYTYTQTAGGVLEIEIAGTAPGVEYDRLSTAGLALLDGTLRVTLLDGYVPPSGATFDVLTYGARFGEFAALELPAGLSIEYLPAAVRLMASAAPCPGDLDGDGAVALADLTILLSHFGTLAGATASDGDLDGDGDVDIADLAALLSAYGSTC